MKKFIVAAVVSCYALSTLGCSLVMTSESLVGTSLGHACVEISAPIEEKPGLIFRMVGVEQTKPDGSVVDLPVMNLLLGNRYPLMFQSGPMGQLNIISLHAVSVNKAILYFINGNRLTVTIDATGRVTPNRICVKHSGITQVRGYAGDCP